MPKVTVNYDSDAYVLDVSVNGVPIDNVRSVHFQKGSAWDDPEEVEVNCCIETQSTSEDGVDQYTRLMASESVEGQAALRNGASADENFKGFVKETHVSAHNSFAKFAEKLLCL
jgi:hypothetical protein